MKKNDKYYDKTKKDLSNCFVERLVLMTNYIETTAKQKDSDGIEFKDKYWIRSTGSDPHQSGQHALFFVNRKNQEGYENDKRKKEKLLVFINLMIYQQIMLL